MFDLLEHIRQRVALKKVAATHGGEYAGPCPACGGEDRFRIWPEQREGQGSWWCRGCNQGGDAISYLMQMEGMDFKSAARAVGRDLDDYRPPTVPVTRAKKSFQARARMYFVVGSALLMLFIHP